MKIKVLELPLWVSNNLDMDRSSGTLEVGFNEIEPLFNRDGYYLIDNKCLIIYNTKFFIINITNNWHTSTYGYILRVWI
jgi:hypothetical protein